jgi:hypothetical protein
LVCTASLLQWLPRNVFCVSFWGRWTSLSLQFWLIEMNSILIKAMYRVIHKSVKHFKSDFSRLLNARFATTVF